MGHRVCYVRLEALDPEADAERESAQYVAAESAHVGGHAIIVGKRGVEFLVGLILQSEYEMAEKVGEKSVLYL